MLEKKFKQNETLYALSDKVENIYYISDVKIWRYEGDEIIFNFNFPVGFIETKLNICSNLNYISINETSYKKMDNNQTEKFNHLFDSLNRFHKFYNQDKVENIYYLELCFEKETRKMIYESVTKNDEPQLESYMEKSLSNYTYDKYLKQLKNFADYFLMFDLTEINFKEAKLCEAKTLFNLGKYDKALPIFQDLSTHVDYSTAEVFNYISKCSFYLKNLKKAIEMAALAVEIQHDFYQAYNNLAVYYIHNQDPANAMECWEHVLKLKPDHKKAQGNLKVLKKHF
ncbi:MAG: tetratricopeptide repeat protein [Candidatus Muiribacteriota bacterium]